MVQQIEIAHQLAPGLVRGIVLIQRNRSMKMKYALTPNVWMDSYDIVASPQ
jgi:hypothetical protein